MPRSFSSALVLSTLSLVACRADPDPPAQTTSAPTQSDSKSAQPAPEAPKPTKPNPYLAEVERHRVAFLARGIKDYVFVLHDVGQVYDPAQENRRIVVKDGVAQPSNLLPGQPTMEQVFDRARELATFGDDHVPFRFKAEYDQNYDFVRSIAMDGREMIADDEVTFSVKCFSVRADGCQLDENGVPLPEPKQLGQTELPIELKLRGTFLDALRYHDALGEHVVAFTRLLDEDKGNVQLEAQLWSGKGGKGRIERTVKDGEKNCEFDLFAEFLDAALGVTDLDHDGQAELTLAYRMTCTSDVSPWTLKLLMLEGGDKYALRGSSRVDVGGGEQVGGEHEADAAFKKNELFLEHAESVWKKVVGL